MDRVGVIVEETSPRDFFFRVDKDAIVGEHEYIVVKMEDAVSGVRKNVEVLAEVIETGVKNPTSKENVVASDMKIAGRYEYQICMAEILGYVEDGRFYRPKTAPHPSSEVYRADDEMLKNFFKGEAERLPIYIGSLIHRPNVKVPIHLNEMQFHLGIFAQTRAGKSYLSGKFIEEILMNTYFPVVVIDIHGDYVKMNELVDGGIHSSFNTVVYYPPGAVKIEGVSAKTETLNISPKEMPTDALINIIGRSLGDLQVAVLTEVIEGLKKEKESFGLEDIREKVENRVDATDKSQEKARLLKILMRINALERRGVKLPAESIPIDNLLNTKTLSIISLNGMRGYIQDIYASLIIDLLFQYLIEIRYTEKWTPVFLFIEEAHRVASPEGSRYSVETISTAIREGAKFGLYLTLISQRPRSIAPDIMANIGNYAVLRITNRQDQNIIESASESFSERFIKDLPSLNQGEAVLVGPYTPLPAQIKVLNRTTKHYGVTPNLYKENKRLKNERENALKENW